MTQTTDEAAVERCKHGIRRPWSCSDCDAANEPTIASLYAELSAERQRAEQAEQKLAEARAEARRYKALADDHFRNARDLAQRLATIRSAASGEVGE